MALARAAARAADPANQIACPATTACHSSAPRTAIERQQRHELDGRLTELGGTAARGGSGHGRTIPQLV